MNLFLAALGSIIAASGTIPYVIETVQGKTKPRLVSWLTWSLLMSLATAGALADHQFGSAIFSLLGAIATGAIVVTGVRFGNRNFVFLDVACMTGVLVGLVLWRIFNSPAIAVWAAIIIDFVGLIPTIKHAWQFPGEETMLTFLVVGIGGFLTVGASAAGSGWSVTSVGYPLYAAISLSVVAGIVYFRKRLQVDVEDIEEISGEVE